jgi:quinol monooxygenase YgiN
MVVDNPTADLETPGPLNRSGHQEENVMLKDYNSVDWLVAGGNEETFIATWRERSSASRREFPGLVMAKLIRDSVNPRHFVSWALWKDAASLQGWRSSQFFEDGVKTL